MRDSAWLGYGSKDGGHQEGLLCAHRLEQLRKARGSTFKPFPPKNLWFDFDFKGFRAPTPRSIAEAIAQTADAQLHPPIKNFGDERHAPHGCSAAQVAFAVQ